MATEVPLVYTQSPRPIGFPVTYRLVGERLTVDTLTRVEELDLRSVVMVRLTYEQGKLSSGFYKTLLRFRDGRTVSLGSISWSSMLHSANQAPAYAAFVTGLIAVIAQASPQAHLEAGKQRLLWGALAASVIALVAVIVFMAIRSLVEGSAMGALVPLVLGAVMMWQMMPLVWRNRPRPFGPAALPGDLLGGGLSPGASGSAPRARRAPAGP
jgi:hypothetical protein